MRPVFFSVLLSISIVSSGVAQQQAVTPPAAPKPIGRGEPPPATQPRHMLWSAGAPLATGTEERDTPWLWLYPAPPESSPSGAAIIVCPGGGYGGLATAHEGNEVAKFLNSRGIHAFVLKYRLAPYRHPVPMLDVQRAIRLVRSNAADWKVDPLRIGVMGFSAGGHLASTAATHFDEGAPAATDPIDRVSCRPDFAILCYPVISFTTEYVHAGSRKNLLGENPDPELVKLMSNELQVTEKTPPTFLFHTGEDTGVPPENSVLFYMALRKYKIPAEMHIYEPGKHGVGLAAADPILGTWPARMIDWLKTRKVIP
jgi:acetyl esterase/lipase